MNEELQRVRASLKVEYENKFAQKKAQMTETLYSQLKELNEQFKQQSYVDSRDVINSKVNSSRKCQQDRWQPKQNQQLGQNHQLLPRIIELEQELELANELNSKLRLKIYKLVQNFVVLKLYSFEYGQKIQQDDFDLNLLVMPKMQDDSANLKKLQESQMHNTARQKANEDKLLEMANLIDNLKRDNLRMKIKLQKIEIGQDTEQSKLQQRIKELEMLSEQQGNIIIQLRSQMSKRHYCKELNDFIIKKRFRSLHDQPAFDINESSKQIIRERNYKTPLQTSQAQRIHSYTISLK
ncbi:hypothetical protein pb186bvf_006284 [Paramecium bursaria]